MTRTKGTDTMGNDPGSSLDMGDLADLTGRRGVKQGLEAIDHGVRAELVLSLAAIIRASPPSAQGGSHGAR